MNTLMILAHSSDQGYVDELKKHLSAAGRIRPDIVVWDLHSLQASRSWREDLSNTTETCAAAVVLLSASLIASEDLFPYAEALLSRDIHVTALLASACGVNYTAFSEMKTHPKGKGDKVRTLSGLKTAAVDSALSEVVKEVLAAIPA